MKALLMHPDRDFDPQQALPGHESDLVQDLELNTLLNAMAGEDKALLAVARSAVLTGLQNDVATILHRQAILDDCLKNAEVVRELHAIAVATTEEKRRHFYGIGTLSPRSVLYGAVEILPMLTRMLKRLKAVADARIDQFRSKGLRDLFAMVQREFSDEYFAEIRSHLSELKFGRGVLLSAELGRGNEGANYVLRQPRGKNPSWLARLLGTKSAAYSFRVDDRDIVGAEILSDMHTRGINLVANAVAQATDHILSFFNMLRTELAFYVGSLNLRDRLTAKGIPLALPKPEPIGSRTLCFRELHDVCLALTTEKRVIGNDLDANDKSLAIVTGANQGGKSSFLRSVGVAQLMMHSGMFVAAESFAADLCTCLNTHYKREEDTTMKHGKLDEELARMSRIVESIEPNALLLCNESFASTNEREGSEIARQIVCALLERQVKIVFVTHFYEFAHGMFDQKLRAAIFLRAERLADGTRTFKITEGEPLETSFGQDLYKKIFLDDAARDGC